MNKIYYIEVDFIVAPIQPAAEILVAELGELDYESFIDTEKGIKAYILEEKFDEDALKQLFILNSKEFQISYTISKIEQVNWNEEWEKNFNPIKIDNHCMIRAPFHKKEEVTYDIIIEPKMSFGTGHHATTYMMLSYILENDWKDKNVLDMGCGTGVLAILAAMKGAKYIEAIDIDEWCFMNTSENIIRNNCPHIKVYQGDANLLRNKVFDSIIANINRNILLNDMEAYQQVLSSDGSLFLSGFYKEDLPVIIKRCEELGLDYQSHKERDRWIGAKFIKKV